ncbi:MAG: site-2 protease family protein [Oscillospiraceae bacterium]|nr:site-2 protease family protein [Oscillospiraceae bacterium]
MRAGKIFQRVEITPGFVAFLCAYFYFDPGGTFAPFLLGVTLHEGAHLLLLRLAKAQVHRVSFSLSGAVIRTAPLPTRWEILTAAAGPAVNLLLFLLLMRQMPMAALVNLCLFAYNLLPFYPLDGGRILRAVLHALLPDGAADLIERLIGGLCLLGLCAAACYLTCALHAGLWPVILCALIIVKTAGILSPREIFAR